MDSDEDNKATLGDSILDLVNEFLERTQRGERPTIEEYCADHPHQADEIRELFPALVMMEDLGPDTVVGESKPKPRPDFPDQIGDYRIIGEIGRGGMGVVYEAEQESLGRRVALKVLPQLQPKNEAARIRFQREARAAARMHHTNIVPVFEVGQDRNHLFYAMQLIQGQGLDRIIDELQQSGDNANSVQLRQPMTGTATDGGTSNASLGGDSTEPLRGTNTQRHFYRSAARIAIQCAEALEYAHARGVIHRDVKPSNLMLDGDGVVWVTDFGLAKSDDEDTTLTQTGDYLGTLRYMSPERFRGQCDARADIYSTGLTLYELVLRQPAFESNDRMKLIYLINHVDPPKPRSIDNRVPQDLETIILKAIDKNPASRYESARDLSRDLQRFINDEPIFARRISTSEQVLRWAKRNKGLAAALAGSLALLVAMIGVLFVTNARERNLRVTAQDAEAEATKARDDARIALDESREAQSRESVARQAAEEANKSSEKARRELESRELALLRQSYRSDVNLAAQGVGTSANIGQVTATTRRWNPATAPLPIPDFRGWEWFYLRSVVEDNNTSLDAKGLAWKVAWSPDDALLAVISLLDVRQGFQKDIFIRNAVTGETVKRLSGHTNSVISISWNAKTNRIASSAFDKTIRIWDPETGATLQMLGPFDEGVKVVQWDHVGQRLAYAQYGAETKFFIVDLTKPQPVAEPLEKPPYSLRIQKFSFSPDGKRLATVSHGAVCVWDVETKKRVFAHADAQNIAWKDGHDIAGYLSCDQSGDIILGDPQTGKPKKTFVGLASKGNMPQRTRDGKYLVAGSRDNTVRVWDWTSGYLLRTFQRHTDDVYLFEINNAGDRVFSFSKHGHIWRLNSRAHAVLYRSFVPDVNFKEAVADIDWHPDNNRLAAVMTTRQLVRVWNVRDRELLPATQPAANVRWSPDGKHLLCSNTDLQPNGGLKNLRVVGDHLSTIQAPIKSPGGVSCITWHPTQNRLLFGGYKYLHTFNMNDGRGTAIDPTTISPPRFDHPRAAAWHPRKTELVALGTGYDATIWDLDANRVVGQFQGHTNYISGLAWNYDGTRLATTSRDGTARVWDGETAENQFVLRGHNNSVNAVCWSPDGKRLATCGADGTVRIWDADQGEELLTLRDLKSEVQAIAWSRDGTKIAAGGKRGMIIVWDASPAYELEPGKRPVPPGLTPAIAEASPKRRTAEIVSTPGKLLGSVDWQWSRPRKLGPGVNTPHAEYEPSLTTDQLTIVFHSDRPGGQGGFDLWMSRRDARDEPWKDAVNLGEIVNGTTTDESPHISPDGLTLYFASDRRDGIRNLWMTSRKSPQDQWASPVPVDEVNTTAAEIEPGLSADGLTMVFASTRQPKQGIFDIWMCTRANKGSVWSKPRRLPFVVNSDEWQGSPTLLGDGFGSAMVIHSGTDGRFSTRGSRESAFNTSTPLDPEGRLGGVYSPWLSEDGKTLYFRKLDHESNSYDLWVSERVKK